MLAALEAAGYDRDFDALRAAGDLPSGAGSDPSASTPSPGCGAITVDHLVGAVRLPPGVAIDLGGIGKGYTADLVAADLLAAGARGVLVNMGGDLRADR